MDFIIQIDNVILPSDFVYEEIRQLNSGSG